MTVPAPATDVEPSGMTDLEQRLRGSDGLQIHAAVLSRLAHLDDAMGAMVGRGLTREDFHRAQAIRGAIKAARDFMAMRR